MRFGIQQHNHNKYSESIEVLCTYVVSKHQIIHNHIAVQTTLDEPSWIAKVHQSKHQINMDSELPLSLPRWLQ